MAMNVIGVAWLLNALAQPLAPGYDTFAYWSVDTAQLYGASSSAELGAFRYSPLAARSSSPSGPFLGISTTWAIWQPA